MQRSGLALLLAALLCLGWPGVGPSAGPRLAAAFAPFPRAAAPASPRLLLPGRGELRSSRRRFKPADEAGAGQPPAPAARLDDGTASATGVVPVQPGSGIGSGLGGGAEGWLWRGCILLLTIVWATNFAVIKVVLDVPGVDVSLYAASRFAVASAAMLPFLFRASSPEVLARGMECGAWISLGYVGQALGLLTTSADKSAFICSLNVLFVAITVGLLNKRLDPRSLAAALVACTGVGLIELGSEVTPSVGDLLSLCQPVGFGMGYIRLEEIMRRYPDDALPVTASKLIVVAITCLGWASVVTPGALLPDFTPVLSSGVGLSVILYTGLVTTAGAVALESVAFKRVPATDATVILASEPLWAALFSFFLVGEELTSKMGLGAALIVAACLYNELRPGKVNEHAGEDHRLILEQTPPDPGETEDRAAQQ